jgi:hypothetical protein
MTRVPNPWRGNEFPVGALRGAGAQVSDFEERVAPTLSA